MTSPTDVSTVANFISELRRKKDIWYDIYSQHEAKPADKGGRQTGQYNNPFRPNFNSNLFRGFGYGRPSMPYVGNSNPYGNRPFVPYSNQGPYYGNNYQNNNNTPQQAT